jgi:hypothetical protein
LSFEQTSHGWLKSQSAFSLAFFAASSAFFLAHLAHGVFPNASFASLSLLLAQATHGAFDGSTSLEWSAAGKPPSHD